MRQTFGLFLTAVLGLFACGPAADGSDGGGGGIDARPGGNEFIDAGGVQGCTQMDFVFVIDDSGSMLEEQQNLSANFPGFVQVLDAYRTVGGQPLDYRMAITSAGRDVSYTVHLEPGLGLPPIDIPFTEFGLNGEFVQDCGMTRRWLERDDPNLANTFSCAASLGTSGPGAEMPLLGLEWSLNRRIADGTNAGFLRPDALLAIVMITDQDDCSREDDNFTFDGGLPTCFDPANPDPAILSLDYYLNFLDTLTGSRQRWASAVIAGPGPGPCTSGFSEAAEAVRMSEFVTLAGDNSVFSSICDSDLTSALAEAISQFETACNAFPPVE